MKNFIIGYRMGGNEPTLENGIQIAKILKTPVLNYCMFQREYLPLIPSRKSKNSRKFNSIMRHPDKSRVNIPVIVVNGIRMPQQAEYLVENNLLIWWPSAVVFL